MTHAHDRTFLRSIGFDDPDRRTPEHDLACRYLGELPQRQRLTSIVTANSKPLERWAHPNSGHEFVPVEVSIRSTPPLFEEPCSKGSGKYRTTIGFADMTYVIETWSRYARVVDGVEVESFKIDKDYRRDVCVIVEVKSQPVPAATIVKQLKIYGQHPPTNGNLCEVSKVALVAATLYRLEPGDADMLRSQGIIPIMLGQPFRDWLTEYRRAQQSEPLERVEEF